MKKHLKTHRNELAFIVPRSSIWIALLAKHVKTNPQRLEFATPPLVLLDCTVHEPNASKPTFVKGGLASVLSGGMTAICCTNIEPRSFLDVTQELISFLMAV